MERRLSAILAADVVGYSRLMGADEAGTYNVACGYTQLGDIETALDMIERSIRGGGHELANYAKHDSNFDPIRNHPRFQKLISGQ
jgi:adenylate cyclase